MPSAPSAAVGERAAASSPAELRPRAVVPLSVSLFIVAPFSDCVLANPVERRGANITPVVGQHHEQGSRVLARSSRVPRWCIAVARLHPHIGCLGTLGCIMDPL